MLNKIKSFVISFSNKNQEILILIFFGICYRTFLHYILYSEVTILNDSEGYQYLAKKIQNLNLSGYNGERTLGYPILIFLSLNSLKLLVFYQHILGIFTSIFCYKTFLNFSFSKKNSLIIVLFTQSFLNVFFYESSILVESLTFFIISIIVYQISNNFIENIFFSLDITISFLLGYLTLIKPFYAFIPFIIYGFIVLKKFHLRSIINKRIVILFFSLISYFGWSYFNKVNIGYFTSTTFLGLNLSQNCVYFAEKGTEKYKWISDPYVKHRDVFLKKYKGQSAAMAIWDTYDSGEYDYKKLKFADLSNELGKYAIETIKNNPKDYMKQVITKSWFDFWKSSISVNKNDFKSNNKQFIIFYIIWFLQNKILFVFKLSFLFLIPFYIYNFFKNRVITNELIIVAIIFTTSILQGLITYGTNSRYGFPFEYLMILIVVLFIRNTIKLPRFLSNYLQ